MKGIILFVISFFYMHALQAQSNSFNLTDTLFKLNSRYTVPSADIYNPCSNRFNPGKIDSLKQFLRSNPTINIEIAWHTDQRGSSRYNDLLSYKYAAAFKQLLLDSTITPDRILAIGCGESQLLYNDQAIELFKTAKEQESAYQQNRRVEITILKL